MKVKHILFENYKDLKNAYDNIANEYNFDNTLNDIRSHANDMGIKDQHPVDIFSKLVKSNILLVISGGSKAPDKAKDASMWTKYLNKSVEQDEVLQRLDAFHSLIIETLINWESRIEQKRYEKELKSEYKLVTKGDDWKVVKPHTKEASCHLGSETRWCISSRGSDNHFETYNEVHDIYIIHTRYDKYAIIANRKTRVIVEVQYRDNELKEPTEKTLIEFRNKLESDAVDIEQLEQELSISFPTQYTTYEITPLGIEEGYTNHMDNGKVIQRYTLPVKITIKGDKRQINTGTFQYDANFISVSIDEEIYYSSTSFTTKNNKYLRSLLTLEIVKQMSESNKHKGVISDEFQNDLNIKVGNTLEKYGISRETKATSILDLV
ncbi:hypothetical protein PBI_SCTP2_40 [Salicola phage SCTP-2]|nr:hypothetical protein PBI_SCTP2_40 [Salicola phage SCTP-2]